MPAFTPFIQWCERVVLGDDDVVKVLGVGDAHDVLECPVGIMGVRGMDMNDADIVIVAVLHDMGRGGSDKPGGPTGSGDDRTSWSCEQDGERQHGCKWYAHLMFLSAR